MREAIAQELYFAIQQGYFFQLSLNPEAEEAVNVIRATGRGSGQLIQIVSSDSYCIL